MMYVGYALLALLGILVVCLIIAVIRTLLIKDTPHVKPEINIPLELQNAYAKSFSEMIKIKTISSRSGSDLSQFKKLQEVMAKEFPNVHQVMEKTYFDGGSLIFRWVGKDSKKRPYLYMAHQDVVPAPKEGWKRDPFSGDIIDGEIWGRGTFDTKCTLFAFFKAADELIAEGFVPETDIYLASSSDEEIAGVGAQATVAWLQKQGINPRLVLDEGGAIVEGVLPTVSRPMALLGVIEKGYVDLKVKAISSGGHSSNPPRNTPLERLAEFIVDIKRHPPMKTKMIPAVEDMFVSASKSMGFGLRLLFGNMWLFRGLISWLLPKINSYGRAMLSTTVAFTQAKGSDASNVIPSEAYLIVNLRPHPIQDREESIEVIKKIAKKYDLECEEIGGRPSTPSVNVESEAYKFLEDAIKANYPDVLISPYVILGGTDARHYSAITDAAIRFSPVRINNADLKKMHGINESIKIETVAEAVRFYRYLMKEGK